MGPVRGQSYQDWRDQLSSDDAEAILRAHFENELQHLLDMDTDAEVQEELDGRA